MNNTSTIINHYQPYTNHTSINQYKSPVLSWLIPHWTVKLRVTSPLIFAQDTELCSMRDHRMLLLQCLRMLQHWSVIVFPTFGDDTFLSCMIKWLSHFPLEHHFLGWHSDLWMCQKLDDVGRPKWMVSSSKNDQIDGPMVTQWFALHVSLEKKSLQIQPAPSSQWPRSSARSFLEAAV